MDSFALKQWLANIKRRNDSVLTTIANKSFFATSQSREQEK